MELEVSEMIHPGIGPRCRAGLLSLLICMLLVPAMGVHAQDPSQAPPTPPVPTDPTGKTKTTDANTADQDAEAAGKQDAPATQDDNSFHVAALGKASWLDPTVKSPIRIGPIYTSNISVSYLQGNGLHFDPTTQNFVTGTDRFAILSANLVYNHDFRRFGFTVQYIPQLAITDGQLQTDFSDQNISIASTILLTPRLAFSVRNTLSSQNGQTLFGEFSLDVNNITGQTAGSPFLQNFHRQIFNDTTLTFDYRLDEKNTLSFSPDSHLNDGYVNNVKTLAYDYGAQVSFAHRFSEEQSYNVYGSFDRRYITDAIPVGNYYGLGVGYTDRLTQTLTVHGEVGLSALVTNGGSGWTGAGRATVRKDFQSSNISLSFSRGNSFGAFLESGYSDRVDLSYDQQVGRRLSFGIGAAYETGSNVYSAASTFHGYYLNGRAAYRLGRGFTLAANVGSRQQDGTAVAGIAGRTTYVSTTLTWEPMGEQGKFGPY
jgi:hypothetical protein